MTPAMLRFHTCRSGALLFSGQSLRRTGAVEIFGTGARTADKADGRPAMRMVFAQAPLQRPWAQHRTYDWRSGQFDAGGTVE